MRAENLSVLCVLGGSNLIFRTAWPVKHAQLAFIFGLAAIAASTEANQAFDDLVKAKYVHCAFFRNSVSGNGSGNPYTEEDAELLLYFEEVDVSRHRARTISTRLAGSRDVTVLRGKTGVHFVDNVAGSVNVTTVFACQAWEFRGGKDTCWKFSAANIWHFDFSVYSDPDAAFEKYKADASYGFCDFSFRSRN